jgi:hypothetical protein
MLGLSPFVDTAGGKVTVYPARFSGFWGRDSLDRVLS